METFDFTMDCGTDMGDTQLIREIADQYHVEPENIAITSSASEGNIAFPRIRDPKIEVENSADSFADTLALGKHLKTNMGS